MSWYNIVDDIIVVPHILTLMKYVLENIVYGCEDNNDIRNSE